MGNILIPARINKSRGPKPIPLARIEVRLLRERLLVRPLGTHVVFATEKGGVYSHSGFQSIWLPALLAGGLAHEEENERGRTIVVVDSAISCNCSMCRRRGSLLWFVPRDRLRLLTPEESLSTYLFNKHAITNRFCAACGIHAYAEGTDPKGNRMAGVNIRCLENLDLDAVPVTQYDGRSK